MRRAKWLALRIRILLTSLKTYNHISIWEINLSSSAYRNWKPLFSLSWAWTNVRQTLGSHINKVSCCYLCNCYNTGYVGCCVVVRSLNHVQPHGLQHARLPCPSPTPGACSDSCALSQDAIQPSHPLLSPSPHAFNPSQHQGLFQWVSSSHQVAKVLELQLQHQSF